MSGTRLFPSALAIAKSRNKIPFFISCDCEIAEARVCSLFLPLRNRGSKIVFHFVRHCEIAEAKFHSISCHCEIAEARFPYLYLASVATAKSRKLDSVSSFHLQHCTCQFRISFCGKGRRRSRGTNRESTRYSKFSSLCPTASEAPCAGCCCCAWKLAGIIKT